MTRHDRTRVAIVGLFVSLARNVLGWLGNNLALASFGLVLVTKIPLALAAGWILES